MNDSVNSQQKLIRFQQRLSNLNHSFDFLKETIASTAAERIKNAAIVKAFEMTFELSWKALKDYLEYQGISLSAPREVIKEAFKTGYLEDGQTWIDLLDHRNELVHIYNEEDAIQATGKIQKTAMPCLEQLIHRLNSL